VYTILMKHIDPVCGMVVKEETAKGTYEYKAPHITSVPSHA